MGKRTSSKSKTHVVEDLPNIQPADFDSKMEGNNKHLDVWWDMETAPVPYDCPDNEVYGRILEKLKAEGFCGRVRIRGIVGYTNSLKKGQKRRIYEGRLVKKIFKIGVVHEYMRPKGSAKNQAAKKIIDIIESWLKKGRKPRNVMLFTGDNRLADTLEELKQHGHTTLLVCLENHRQHCTSVQVRKFADQEWFLREFLSLPRYGISKKIRLEMEKAERKRKREAKTEASTGA